MAMRRRRRSTFRRKGAPGKSFWIRPPVFSLEQRVTNPGLFADLILTESDFSNPSIFLNDTQKGAPVMERLVCDIGFGMVVSDGFFNPAGFNQVALLVEYMIWTQSDQFVVHPLTSALFDLTLENERVLAYGVMDVTTTPSGGVGPGGAGTRQNYQLHHKAEPKVKVKLRERALGVAIRTNFDLADASVLSIIPWVQPTMLVRVP